MKNIVTLLLTIVINFCYGQNLICIQSPNGAKPIFVTRLDSAVAKAKSGDCIYISGGDFTGNPSIYSECRINKRLFIYGAGYNKDSSKVTGTTEYAFNIFFDNGSTGSTLTGIIKYGGGSLEVKDSNITVSRNYLGTLLTLHKGAKNLIIKENIIGLAINSGIDPVPFGNPIPLNNSLISNNIFLHYAGGNGENGGFNDAIIANNIFVYLATRNSNLGIIINSHFKSNILLNSTVDTSYRYNIMYSEISNNLFVCDSPYFKTNIYNWGNNSGLGNLFNQPISSIFQKYTGLFPNPFTKNYDWLKTHDFHLKPTSQGKNKGTDGKDVGIYGGQYPFKDGGIPENPHFVSAKFTTIVNPKYKLPINVIATAQGANNKIIGYRYFFDNNYDSISYVNLTNPQANAHILEDININPSVLDTGFHKIFFQVKDSNGLWSSVIAKQFMFYGQSKLTKIINNKGGNGGDVTVNIYGSGFYEGTKVKLVKGADTISVADSSVSIMSGSRIITTFNLRSKSIGFYDLIVEIPDADTTLVLKKSFEVVIYIPVEIKTSIIGPNNIRTGIATNFIVQIQNYSNCDVIGVPIIIFVSGDTKVNFLETIRALNGSSIDSVSFFELDSLHGQKMNVKAYWLLIDHVFAGSNRNLNVEIKSQKNNENIFIEAIVNDPYFASPLSQRVKDCYNELIDKIADDIEICRDVTNIDYYNNFDEFYRKSLNYAVSTSVGDIKNDFMKLYKSCETGVNIAKSINKSWQKTLLKLSKVASGKLKEYNPVKCKKVFDGDGENSTKMATSIASMDPNDKLGLLGFNGSPYFNPLRPFNYQIRFENVDSATAPAQQVIIIDTLDKSVFDLATFQLGMVTVGDTIVSFSSGLSADSMYVDLSDKGINATVKIKGGLDTITGIATWVFDGLDPETLLPITDALGGFLPPNKKAPEGEGSVFYTIDLKKNLPNNTNIKNKAYIFFDANPAIITPEWKNVLDIVKPASKVDSLSTIVTDSLFSVKWRGNDVGSGVVSYSIYYKVNNGNYNLWLANTSETSAVFNGSADSTYSFYSIARDSALNIEDAPIIHDAKTTVRVSTGIAYSSLYNNSIYTKVYPNPANESFTVKIYNERTSEYEISLLDIMGNTISKVQRNGANSPEFIIDTDNLPEALYFLVISNKENLIFGKHRIVVMKR